MLEEYTGLLGIELYFSAKSSFCLKKINMAAGHVSEHTLQIPAPAL